MSSIKCPLCGLINFADTQVCRRCTTELVAHKNSPTSSASFKDVAVREASAQTTTAVKKKRGRSWWKVALLISFGEIVLTFLAALIHADILLGGRLSPAQEEALYGLYGRSFGIFLIVTWIISYAARAKDKE